MNTSHMFACFHPPLTSIDMGDKDNVHCSKMGSETIGVDKGAVL